MCKKCPNRAKFAKMPKIAQKRPKTFNKTCENKTKNSTAVVGLLN